MACLTLLVVAVVAAGGYFWVQHQKDRDLVQTPVGRFLLPSAQSEKEGDANDGWCGDRKNPGRGWVLTWRHAERRPLGTKEAGALYEGAFDRCARLVPGNQKISLGDFNFRPIIYDDHSISKTTGLVFTPDQVPAAFAMWSCGEGSRMVSLLAWDTDDHRLWETLQAFGGRLDRCHL